MGEAARKIGWGRLCSAAILVGGAAFLGWSGLRFQRLIAEIAALNHGETGYIQFPIVWFVVSWALLGGTALVLRWSPILAAVVSVGVALCAQMLWLAALF